ncbi:hypothetical protein KIJ96_04270 [Pseudoalteromonas piscicida]|uniref:hypothetical protein n=1 Tax=Pseudoalteromonas TaxID=53246 RepID=UPI0015725856|nr:MULTISPECIES: hypothetical protein [Pseudoalteromonas]MCF2828926.1 hypothetical protein [Pseudoalteromonas sp. OF5H-5]MCF2829918.1 hypothetical protein [Pseudoalteromonas sp. DL2-H6]MCF2926167.1 hypothetical protein [Pseudoalteromonas sp. DL2-H1]MCG7554375.1 hypothetical protein [Pseudoalteromonas sp. Of11M-6]MCX2769737.1 hypothetical protein [Pseudoalteromonas sp. B530]
MSVTPIIFAKHRQGSVPAQNHYMPTDAVVVLDFSGFETTPFLSQILALNLNKLMAPGLGFQGKLDSGENFAVYYFSETAYRFVASESAAAELATLIDSHADEFDIELVRRHDLVAATISGELAFERLVSDFTLTPGLRISDKNACYGKQSGEVFITTLLVDEQQQYQLIAQAAVLDKWQTTLTDAGFKLVS